MRMDGPKSFGSRGVGPLRDISSGWVGFALALALAACAGLAGCAGTTSSTSTNQGKGSAPTVTSFAAKPASINSGASSTLSWATSGATTITIGGGFSSAAASGSTSVSPTVTTSYTLTATN